MVGDVLVDIFDHLNFELQDNCEKIAIEVLEVQENCTTTNFYQPTLICSP